MTSDKLAKFAGILHDLVKLRKARKRESAEPEGLIAKCFAVQISKRNCR